jgi:hypothetical protein
VGQATSARLAQPVPTVLALVTPCIAPTVVMPVLTELTLITPFMPYLVLTPLTLSTSITVVTLTCEHRERCEHPCEVGATSGAVHAGLL